MALPNHVSTGCLPAPRRQALRFGVNRAPLRRGNIRKKGCQAWIPALFVWNCRIPVCIFVFSIVNDDLERRTMMSSIESTSTANSRLLANWSRYLRTATAPRESGAYAAVLARLRDLAPYAAIELVLPGGSLVALLLWLYRRHKKSLIRFNP
jgi:hypothetical protein